MKTIILIAALLVQGLVAKHLHREKVYQRAFCDRVHGRMEYRLRDGTRVDCQTATYSFEVDFGRHAFESVGQALYYALMTGKRPGIVLIRETRKDDRYIGRVKRLAARYGIYLFVIDTAFRIRAVKLPQYHKPTTKETR
jgi:hypothetical protein